MGLLWGIRFAQCHLWFCRRLFHCEGKMFFLPEVDIEVAALHLDVALLKTLTPTVRILAGEVLLQIVPAAFCQILIHNDGGAAAQLPAVFLHRNSDTFHMGNQVGVVLIIEILFQVVALLFDLLGDRCRVVGQLITAQIHELIFLPEPVIVRQKFCRQWGIQFESQFMQVTSPRIKIKFLPSKYAPYMVVICSPVWYTGKRKGAAQMAMDIRPASALRTEYNELAARSRTTGQPIYITRNGEGDTVLMDLDAFTRREEELDRREAVLDHRAMVLEAELGRLSGAPTYTADQVREAVQQHLQNRRRERHG